MKRHVENRISRIARMIKAGIDAATGTQAKHDIEIDCHYDKNYGFDELEGCFEFLDYDDNCDILFYGFKPDEYPASETFKITDYKEFSKYFYIEHDDYDDILNEIILDALVDKLISIVSLKELSSIFLEDFQGKSDLLDWINERNDEENKYSDNDWKYEWLVDMLPEEIGSKVFKEVSDRTIDAFFNGSDSLLKKAWVAIASNKGGIKLTDAFGSFQTYDCAIRGGCTVFTKSSILNDPEEKEIMEGFLKGPIDCTITVDGEEYYLDNERLARDHLFSYDKDEIIEITKKEMGDQWDDSIREYLEKNLPETIEYP